jgi:hypothetical protein
MHQASRVHLYFKANRRVFEGVKTEYPWGRHFPRIRQKEVRKVLYHQFMASITPAQAQAYIKRWELVEVPHPWHSLLLRQPQAINP